MEEANGKKTKMLKLVTIMKEIITMIKKMGMGFFLGKVEIFIEEII